jgi:hypothetical protein
MGLLRPVDIFGLLRASRDVLAAVLAASAPASPGYTGMPPLSCGLCRITRARECSNEGCRRRLQTRKPPLKVLLRLPLYHPLIIAAICSINSRAVGSLSMFERNWGRSNKRKGRENHHSRREFDSKSGDFATGALERVLYCKGNLCRCSTLKQHTGKGGSKVNIQN